MDLIVEDDIFESKSKYICHQCNCKTKKAAHLAMHVFKRFPYANIYWERQFNDSSNLSTPGNIVIRGDGEENRFVIAMLGQVFPGKPKFPNSNLDGFAARRQYFSECLEKMLLIPNLDSVSFPWKIACGAAGGYWPAYLSMIQKFSTKTSAKVTILRQPGAI